MATDATGVIAAISGEIADLADNKFVAINDDTTVGAGQAPTLVSAKITGPSTIILVFSEDVTLDTDDPKSHFEFTTSRPSQTQSITAATASINDDGTVTLTVANSLDRNATGTLNIDDEIVSAATDVNFAGGTFDVEAGQIPTVESAKITDSDQITIVFSEDITATLDNYSDFKLTGGTGITPGEARNLTAINGGTNTATHVLTFDGAALPTDATGTIDMTPTFDNSNPPVATGLMDSENIWIDTKNNYDVGDGQIPVLADLTPDDDTSLGNPSITAPTTVTIKFSEAVTAVVGDFTNFVAGGVSKNVTNLSGSGTDTITPNTCLLYTSPSPRDRTRSRMPSSA